MAEIQFIPGHDETVVPSIRLTRSRDGNSGQATFTFEQPTVFQNEAIDGGIEGMYMIDEEGELVTRKITGKFINGQPCALVVTYTMASLAEWDRFIRFMDRYAASHDLGFNKA